MSDERVDAAQRLVDVLEKENEALKRLDFTAAIALVPVKEAVLAEMTKPTTTPARPTTLAQRLSGLAAENWELLERAIAVQTRIVRIVARAGTPPTAMARYNGNGARALSRTTALALSTRA